MANKTTNYDLTKPLSTEFYDVEVQNGNMDKIDEVMAANDSKKVPSKSTMSDTDTVLVGHTDVNNGMRKMTWATFKSLLNALFAPKSHTTDKANPHAVTKAQVGLGNVPDVATNDQTPTYTAATSLSALVSGEKLSVAFGKLAKAVSDLITHLSNKNNPHEVTKSQVGLENVPNVSTNNQTPTYTAASTLTALSSGEKLSVAFGKIAKAISDLLSHIANKSNPHSVTAAQVGAVPTTRKVNDKELSADIDLTAHDVKARPRRNLLNNPRFRVNQRGLSSYTTQGYTVDRIRIAGTVSGANVTVTDDGFTVTSAWCLQYLDAETEASLLGATVTVSWLDGNGVLRATTGTVPATVPNSPVDVVRAGIFGLWSNGTRLYLRYDGNTTYQAVKLEIGEGQTLAYQDADGNWQLYDDYDYVADLAACTVNHYEIENSYLGDEFANEIGAVSHIEKPTGTYTGNGTARTIEIGGVSQTVKVSGGGKGTCIVTDNGGIRQYTTQLTGLANTNIKYGNGKLVLSAASEFNQNGQTYYYQVL